MKERIIAELSKVDGTDVTVSHAMEALDSFVHYEESGSRGLAGYHQVWEHPEITAKNAEPHPFMDTLYFTLYEVNPDLPNLPKFKLVVGRIGVYCVWDMLTP